MDYKDMNAIDLVRQMVADGQISQEVAEKYFPELKGSEDEKIKKAIKQMYSFLPNKPEYIGNVAWKDIIAWLENQGRQKPFDYESANIKQKDFKPKFEVGDFVINDYCFGKVIKLTDDAYLLDTGQGIPFSCEHNARVWTIQDAKPGDVLATKDSVFIFKHLDKTGLSLCKSYCEVIGNSDLGLGFEFSINGIYPATKERRDLLFQKMKEAGYEWDAEKKELKKVEQKPSWSKEDEQYLLICKNALYKYERSDKWDARIISRWLENKIKSLRSQNRWKPSEEQMCELSKYCPDNIDLTELLEQLKKLK